MASLADNFNRADNASSLGSTSTGSVPWSALAGVWGIFTNRARSTTSGAVTIAVVDCGSADGSVKVTVAARTGADQPGLALRMATNGNGYLLESGNGSSKATLFKGVSGTYTVLAQSAANLQFSAGDVIEVVLAGSSITCKRNGSTIITATDSTYNAVTKHGLYYFGGAGTRELDDFSYIEPAFGDAAAHAWTALDGQVAHYTDTSNGLEGFQLGGWVINEAPDPADPTPPAVWTPTRRDDLALWLPPPTIVDGRIQ